MKTRSPHPLDTVTRQTSASLRRTGLWLFGLAATLTLVAACAVSVDNKHRLADTANYLAARAMNMAGRAVLNAAIGEMAGNDADFLDSVAAGLRSQTPELVTATDVAQLVAIWGAPKPAFSKLGVDLADTFHEASRGAPKALVLESLADGLNRAAAQDRLP